MMFGSVVTNAALFIVSIFAVYKVISALWNYITTFITLNKIPGPFAYPILGNASFDSKSKNDDHLFLTGLINLHGRAKGLLRIWFGPFPIVFLTSPDTVEPLITSNIELQKGIFYDPIKNWLKEGLITTSNEALWFQHRKLLTPAFHFNILEDFLIVMNEQAEVLLSKLHKVATGETFNIQPYIKMSALAILSESAMGTKFDTQNNEHQEYVRAVAELLSLMTIKSNKFWLRLDFLYRFSKYYEIEERCLKILRRFTAKVIEEKKKAKLEENKITDNKIHVNGIESKTSKKKLAFIDLLLTTKTEDGQLAFTDKQIQEQVDTFMFAGHDTTTHSISWFLYIIGHHPEIQEKCYEEICDVFENLDGQLSLNDLRRMKYLEYCIKESLRLYPILIAVGRRIKNDMKIRGFDIPAGTSLFFFIEALHSDPNIWPDPQKFDPERFRPENFAGKSPYSFIPFSAGPRNCIGQRFALNEEKVILSNIIRNFKIKSVDARDRILIDQSPIKNIIDGFNVQLTPR